MKKKLTLGVSPLTNTVYAGSLLKCGRVWSSDKTDVTNEFLACIKQFVGVNCEMNITIGGVTDYVLSVTEPGYVSKVERELRAEVETLKAQLAEATDAK